ncbi:MAG: trigger factor [Fusobacteriaceae bacterium]
MKHLVTRKENSAVEIIITLTKEELTPIKSGILKELAKKVEVPGFRKGHAPLDKVESNFADAIREELTETVLKAHYEEVLKAENVNPVSYIYNVKTENTNGDFQLTFMLDEYPTVTLGTYKGLEVEKRTFEFKEEALTREIDALVASKTTLVDAEAGYKAVMGDTVNLAFDGSIDGVPFDGGKADSHDLKLGSKMFIDNFEEQIVGYVIGQEGEVNVTFPTEYNHKPLAGKAAIFKIKINAIKKTVKPELNDELAKELGFESVADLTAKKKEDVIKKEEMAIENEVIGKLMAKISESSKVEIPHSMVMREVENKVKEMEQHLSMQGANMEMYLKMMGKTMEQMTKEMMPMSASKVKADIILEDIAKKENLVITEEEMTTKMVEIAKMYGMDLPKLEAELKKNNNLENFKANLNIDITLEKAIKFLLANNSK